MGTDQLRHRLAQAGAWLFVAGLITGLWAGVVLTETVKVPIPRLALAAHLNGILGGLWLIAVAWTLDRMRYGLAGRWRLGFLIGLATWANWLITLIASILGVRGLEYTRDLTNNAVTALLEIFVVLPALAGALTWAYGFGGPPRSPD